MKIIPQDKYAPWINQNENRLTLETHGEELVGACSSAFKFAANVFDGLDHGTHDTEVHAGLQLIAAVMVWTAIAGVDHFALMLRRDGYFAKRRNTRALREEADRAFGCIRDAFEAAADRGWDRCQQDLEAAGYYIRVKASEAA